MPLWNRSRMWRLASIVCCHVLLVVLACACATDAASESGFSASTRSLQERYQVRARPLHYHRMTQEDLDPERITNGDEAEEDSPKHRIPIRAFALNLAPAPNDLDTKTQKALYRELVSFLQTSLMNRMNVNTEVTLEYVQVGQVKIDYVPGSDDEDRRKKFRRRLESPGTWHVVVAPGVASILGSGAPSRAQVNKWIREDLETELLPTLQGTEDFAFIDSVDYEAMEQEDDLGEVSAVAKGSSAPSDTGPNAGLITGVVLGALAAVVLVGLFAVKHRRKRVLDTTVIIEEETSKDESIDNDDSVQQQQKRSNKYLASDNKSMSDARSVADQSSVSGDWTVNTEADDSAVLKNISTKQALEVVPTMVSTESFQRDRPFTLQKDMLTSAWSGRASGFMTNNNESVLQPSHFVASTERHVQRQTNAARPSPYIAQRPDEDDKVDDDSSPFVFEQAHESHPNNSTDGGSGEVYLMPPSQAHKVRARPIDSAELL